MNAENQEWKNLFDIDVLKDSILMIALYITVYELLEDTVIAKPKDFFTIVDWDEEAQAEYRKHVLSLYDPNAIPGINKQRKDIISSLLWFKKLNAIDDGDIQVFTDSKQLRNSLTHQMFQAIGEGGSKYVGQFCKMYDLFCKIERWWIMEVEIPISGDYDPDKIDEMNVMSGHMVILHCILDMLEKDSNAKYKDICDAIGVSVK